jgi:hypothetical protein
VLRTEPYRDSAYVIVMGNSSVTLGYCYRETGFDSINSLAFDFGVRIADAANTLSS